MSLKHFILLSLILCDCAYAANGIPIPKYTPAFSGPYLEANIGVARVDWKHFGSQFGPRVFADNVATSGRYLEGGFMGGADGGYQFNKNLAMEFGAVALPRARAQGAFLPVAFPASSEAKGYFIYLGGKLQKRFASDNFFFFKLAAAYRYTEYRTISLSTGIGFSQKTYRVTPLFGVGITHFFTPAFSMNIQYIHLPALVQNFTTFTGGNVSSLNAPAVNIFLVGLGYMYDGSYQGIE